MKTNQNGEIQEAFQTVDNQHKEGLDMKTYVVYRLVYNSMLCEPVGELVERRSEERENNTDDLLTLAERRYPSPSPDSHLVIAPE